MSDAPPKTPRTPRKPRTPKDPKAPKKERARRPRKQREKFDIENATLEQAKAWLRARFNDGADCPCCHQHVKLYKRPLNAAMAYVLFLVYRWHTGKTAGGLPNPEWLHVPGHIAKEVAGNPRRAAAVRGDWAKLTHWGLLEAQASKRDDGSKRTGYYRITERGIAFVRGMCTVQSYIYIYNETMLDRPIMERTSFRECLGLKFNYDDLMQSTLPVLDVEHIKDAGEKML